MRPPLRVLAISSYSGAGGSQLADGDFIAHRLPGVDVEALLVTGGQMEDLLDVPFTVRCRPGAHPGIDTGGTPPATLAVAREFVLGLQTIWQ